MKAKFFFPCFARTDQHYTSLCTAFGVHIHPCSARLILIFWLCHWVGGRTSSMASDRQRARQPSLFVHLRIFYFLDRIPPYTTTHHDDVMGGSWFTGQGKREIASGNLVTVALCLTHPISQWISTCRPTRVQLTWCKATMSCANSSGRHNAVDVLWQLVCVSVLCTWETDMEETGRGCGGPHGGQQPCSGPDSRKRAPRWVTITTPPYSISTSPVPRPCRRYEQVPA